MSKSVPALEHLLDESGRPPGVTRFVLAQAVRAGAAIPPTPTGLLDRLGEHL